jgi:transcriptional regulator with XRE-family HTH domain
MLKTPAELQSELGLAIRDRRIAQGWSQRDAAARSGVPYSTWRRLEADGEGSTKHLIQAAIALRCEDNLGQLFPTPAASSLDALLARQAAEAAPTPRRRASRRSPP